MGKGLITPEQLNIVLEARSNSNKRVGELVVMMGFANEDDIAQALAEQYLMDWVDPSAFEPEPAALRLVPASFALNRGVLPLWVDETSLTCLISDPLDVNMTDDLQAACGKILRLKVAPVTRLKSAIAKAYELPFGNPASASSADSGKKKRKRKLDPQTDRIALLDALSVAMGGY